MRRLLPLLLVLACAAVPGLHAQPGLVRPGAGAGADRIRPGTEVYDVFIEGLGSDVPVRMTLQTTHADVDGVPALVRRETLRAGSRAVRTDWYALDSATLAPLRVRGEGISGDRSLAFEGDRVRGWTRRERRRDTVDVALPGPVFFSSVIDLALASLPLQAGYEARLAVYDSDQGLVTAQVTVTGLEEVRADGGRVRAWAVRVRGTGSAGTYWMEEGTQTLVQFVSAAPGMRIVRSRGTAK